MASIPGAAINLTGASGSQGLLAPMSGWKVYVFPQGGHASQSSTGTLITLDSAAIAARFAANNWIQVGLNTANIRQISAVGGNSINVSGSALTVAENDRVFLIGNTQPTVVGGSATYTIPASRIRQRGDDTADLYTNSMVTSDSNGLAQFWAEQNTFDCMIQDANGSNSGSIIDLEVGTSSTNASVFGATVTINAALGVTGWVTLGQSVTITGALGVTGWATFGSTVTMHAQLGVTSRATFGSTVTVHGNAGFTGSLTVGTTATVTGAALVGGTFTVNGAIGVTGWATFGSTVTLTGNFGVTGTAVFGLTTTFGTTIVVNGISGTPIFGSSMSVIGNLTTNRILMRKGATHTSAAWVAGASWGSGGIINFPSGNRDSAGRVSFYANNPNAGSNPEATLTFVDGAWPHAPIVMATRGDTSLPYAGYWNVEIAGTTQVKFVFVGTPDSSTNLPITLMYTVFGTS